MTKLDKVENKMLSNKYTEYPFNYKDFFKNYYIFDFVNKSKNNAWRAPFELNSQQEQLLNLVLQNDYVVCKKGRQLGATTFIAALLLTKALLLDEDKNLIYIAPNKQTATDMSSKILDFIKQLPLDVFNKIDKPILKRFNTSFIQFNNNVTIRFYSVENFNLCGISNIDFVALDEVSYMEPSALLKCLYTLNIIKTKILAVSTPRKNDIIFSEMYRHAPIKFSMNWWNDPRFNKNLFWIRNDDILYRTHSCNYEDLIQNNWLPTNQWCEEMQKCYNYDEENILTEIYGVFI